MICNDFMVLNKHISSIESYRQEMIKTHKIMEQRIHELNINGFQDGNFEQLYQTFMENVDTIKRIEHKMIEAQQYCQQLSQIIKCYYDVEI